ncbi:hypothetical protein D3C71_979920 [compost metagenome]
MKNTSAGRPKRLENLVAKTPTNNRLASRMMIELVKAVKSMATSRKYRHFV